MPSLNLQTEKFVFLIKPGLICTQKDNDKTNRKTCKRLTILNNHRYAPVHMDFLVKKPWSSKNDAKMYWKQLFRL